jgi:hypothetical protein
LPLGTTVAVKVGAAGAGAIATVAVCTAAGLIPLAAFTPNVKLPATVGDPESTPAVESTRPGGSSAASTAE